MKILTLLFAGLLAGALNAQEIRPQIRKLSPEQKLAVLEYMRNRGADIDREIQMLYDQLPAAEQSNTRQFIALIAQAPADRALAKIQWNRDTIALGKIEEGAILLDSFVVHNTGTQPYLITHTQTSCDCTVLRYPQFPVMPGESAVVRVEFNSTNKIGITRAGIVLYDNSEPNRRSVLYMDATIVPRKSKGKNPWD